MRGWVGGVEDIGQGVRDGLNMCAHFCLIFEQTKGEGWSCCHSVAWLQDVSGAI